MQAENNNCIEEEIGKNIKLHFYMDLYNNTIKSQGEIGRCCKAQKD